MRFSVTTSLSSLAFGLMLLMPALATAKDVQIVVVPVHAKPNPAFETSVGRLIDKPLKRQAELIPLGQFRAAAKRNHVKPMAVALPRNLKTLGRAVKATHIFLIELTGKGRGATVNTTLFDVSTGRTVLTDSYTLGGPKLTPEVASQMLSPVLDAIGGNSAAAKDDLGADTGDEDTETAKPTAKMGKGKGFAFPGKEGSGEGDDEATDSGEEGDNVVEASVKTEHDPNDPHATPLRLSVGATFMQRNAHIIPGVGTGTAPCYCGTGNNSNPFFPAPEISLEFFPMAFKDGHADNWYDNLGLTADVFFTRVNSYVDTNPNDTIGSTIFNFNAAATYRLNWWDKLTAPDTYFQLGYEYFAFPLTAGAFPGVSYGAPFVGATLHVPIIEQLALIGGANYAFLMTAGDNAATMLGKEASGFGFGAQAGARWAIDHFEITALYRYQLYDISYTGATSLTTRAPTGSTALPVYQNVTLKDSLNEITLMVGYRF